MKSLVSYLAVAITFTGLAVAHDHDGNAESPTGISAPTGTIPTQTGCPTVTLTRELCTTCPIPACLGLATATQRCGCPSAIPTVFRDFPCSKNCEGVFCSTSWSYTTETCPPGGETKPPSSTPTTTTGPGGEGPGGPGPGSPTGSGSGTTSRPPTGTTTTRAPTSSASTAGAMRLGPFWKF